MSDDCSVGPSGTYNILSIAASPNTVVFQVHGLLEVAYGGTPSDAYAYDTGDNGDDPAGVNFVGETTASAAYRLYTDATGDANASVVGTLTVFLDSTVFSVNLSTFASAARCQTVAQAIPSSGS
jgi:hypothetical protein